LSYCRWSDKSDVYIYADTAGYYCCCGCCRMPERNSYHAAAAERMFSHMLRHVRAGDKVPRYALLSMAGEVDEEWKKLSEEVRMARIMKSQARFFDRSMRSFKKIVPLSNE
jgi:hypothetical protein